MTPTDNTQRIPWLRIFVEGLVIVVSILLAFGIDAWWDERGENRQEQALLQGLVKDFRRADSVLAVSRGLHQSKLDAAERLLLWGELADPTVVPEEVFMEMEPVEAALGRITELLESELN